MNKQKLIQCNQKKTSFRMNSPGGSFFLLSGNEKSSDFLMKPGRRMKAKQGLKRWKTAFQLVN